MNPKIVIIIIVILIIILAIIYFLAIIAHNIKKSWEESLKNELNKNNIEYNLQKSASNIYDIDLKIKNQLYLIKFLNVPNYSEIQINNKTTWEIKYGAGNIPGKVQPHKRYANIASFMNLECRNNEIKVVIIIPDAKKITKYINECEIVFVNHQTNVYGTKVINQNDFKLFLEEN